MRIVYWGSIDCEITSLIGMNPFMGFSSASSGPQAGQTSGLSLTQRNLPGCADGIPANLPYNTVYGTLSAQPGDCAVKE